VHVQDLDALAQLRPVLGLEPRDARVAVREREPLHRGGAAQRHAHAEPLRRGLELPVREQRAERLGDARPELLHRDHGRVLAAHQVGEGVRVGPPVAEVGGDQAQHRGSFFVVAGRGSGDAARGSAGAPIGRSSHL
jgi:hypothetical protein